MNLKANKKRTQKGITLIALVVTIVVLLILAGVSLNAIFSENGLINRAKDAQNKMNQATQNDLDSINSLNEWIDGKINGNTGRENESVTNPYDPNGWTMAYVCNNGTWSDTPLTAANGDTIPEGTQIVAKFYATGEKITPIIKGISLPEDDKYKVVIEGNGEMGPLLIEGDEGDTTYAWQTQMLAWLDWVEGGMQGNTVYCITPYVTELTICDGTTNVGDGALLLGISLQKVTLPSTIKEVGKSAFAYCISLPSVVIPNSIISARSEAFCTENENVTKLMVANEAMAKIVNGSYDATAKLVIANENKITQNTINAEEVANHPVVYCGKEVTGYTCDNSAGISKWKIYHSDGKNIYLIADNYITAEYIPSKDGATMTTNINRPNTCYFENALLNKYTGAATITDANITPWLSYLKSSYGGSDNTNNNMKATAYLLDTEIWKGFKNSTKAEYAIGAPTLDMFVASYNTRFAKQIETIAQETGYKVKFTDGNSYESTLDTYDYLTAHQIKDIEAADTMWFASPSADGDSTLMNVGYDGNVMNGSYGNGYLGLHPIVCLEDGVTLEKQEVNGKIVYNIR